MYLECAHPASLTTLVVLVFIEVQPAERHGESTSEASQPQINTTERSLLEKIDSCTLLLESCFMSSNLESTISDSSHASILYSLCCQLSHKINKVPLLLQNLGLTKRNDVDKRKQDQTVFWTLIGLFSLDLGFYLLIFTTY